MSRLAGAIIAAGGAEDEVVEWVLEKAVMRGYREVAEAVIRYMIRNAETVFEGVGVEVRESCYH